MINNYKEFVDSLPCYNKGISLIFKCKEEITFLDVEAKKYTIKEEKGFYFSLEPKDKDRINYILSIAKEPHKMCKEPKEREFIVNDTIFGNRLLRNNSYLYAIQFDDEKYNFLKDADMLRSVSKADDSENDQRNSPLPKIFLTSWTC